jgi:hypothetical protein
MVRLISCSETAWVIRANVRAGGEHTSITLMTTKTGLLNGFEFSECNKSYIQKNKALLLQYLMPIVLRRQRHPRDQN